MVASKSGKGLKSPFERDDSLVIEIGRVISVWGSVSNLLRQLVAKELGCQKVKADTILKGFGGEERRLEFAIRLLQAREMNDSDQAVVKALAKLMEISAERNVIVHGGPVYGAKTGERPLDLYLMDFRYEDDARRYLNAKEYVERHLSKLRRRGSQLFDAINWDIDQMIAAHAAKEKPDE